MGIAIFIILCLIAGWFTVTGILHYTDALDREDKHALAGLVWALGVFSSMALFLLPMLVAVGGKPVLMDMLHVFVSR